MSEIPAPYAIPAATHDEAFPYATMLALTDGAVPPEPPAVRYASRHDAIIQRWERTLVRLTMFAHVIRCRVCLDVLRPAGLRRWALPEGTR